MVLRCASSLLFVLLSVSLGCDDSAGGNSGPDQGVQVRDSGSDAAPLDATRNVIDMTVADVALPDMAPDAEAIVDSAVDAIAPDAGPTLPPVECDEDTAAMPEGAVGQYGPLMRINQFEVPSDAASARAMGCMVVGRNAGSGLANLLTTFEVDLNAEVAVQADGDIDTILYAQLQGWEAAQTGNQARQVALNFLSGDLGPEGQFLIDRDSFVDSNPEGDAQISFEAATTCERLETQTGEFRLELPVDDLVLGLSIVDTNIAGDLSVDETGASLSNGLLSGYLTTESLTQVIRGLKEVCDRPSPPSFCEDVAFLIEGDPATLVPLVALFMGGFDLIVGPDGSLSEDCGLDCNAVSVCIQLAAEPVVATGISD